MSKGWVVVACVWGFWYASAEAYVRTETDRGVPLRWAAREAVVNPHVGCPTGRCFTDAARSAAEEWNEAGARFVFQVRPGRRVPIACHHSDIDGQVTVVWGRTLCGEAWDDKGVIAYTYWWYEGNGAILDADIVFNSTISWNIYDGPRFGEAVDFRRLMLHELGHALGLNHPDDAGQIVDAVMNSQVSVDRLQLDDIRGVQAIYGRTQTGEITRGALEVPGPNASKSGISFVSGWVCDATRIEIAVAEHRVTPAYRLDRRDTRPVCGDTDNGFIAQINWNLLGPGTVTVRLLVDGRELARRSVRVVTYGTEFLWDQAGRWTLEGWPHSGVDTVIRWTESLQNFEIDDIRPRQ